MEQPPAHIGALLEYSCAMKETCSVHRGHIQSEKVHETVSKPLDTTFASTKTYDSTPSKVQHSTTRHPSMTPDDIQQHLRLITLHWNIAKHAGSRAQWAEPNKDNLRSGVRSGKIDLQQLLLLPYRERHFIVKRDPNIDIYLGKTRVYKRTS